MGNMPTSNPSHVANPTTMWTRGMQLGKTCCKRNTICKIDLQPYIYMNFEPQLCSFHAIDALKPLSRLCCFTNPISKPLKYKCVFTSVNNFQRLTWPPKLYHNFHDLCAYFSGMFGNVTFGQLCEWLTGLSMKANLTPPNIQTKLLSKHSGDICKVPPNWAPVLSIHRNPKKREEIKIKRKTRLVFSPNLILAGVSPPVLKFALPEPLDYCSLLFIKSKPFHNKILQIFWTWYPVSCNSTQFHSL